MVSMSLGTSGFWTRSRNWLSPLGSEELNRSLLPTGTTTSLTSGLPSRLTCTMSPEASTLPSALSTSMLGREVVLQTPTMGLALASPPSATSLAGTWIATLLTL